MQRKFLLYGLVAALLILSLEIPAEEVGYSFRAEETLGDGKVYFNEDYRIEFGAAHRPLKSEIIYKRADGRKVASLKIDSSKSERVPDLEFFDERDGYAYGTKYSATENKLESWVQDNPRAKKVSKVLKLDDDVFMLTSLEVLIKKRWPDLASGKSVDVKILSPSRQDTYSATLSSQKDKETAKGSVRIKIGMNNFFVRQFVPEAFVSYEEISPAKGVRDKTLPQDGAEIRITKYEGNSNLLDDKDQAHKVWVTYFYDQVN